MIRNTKYLLVLLILVLPGCKTVMEYRLDECNSAEILQDSSDTENHATRMHGPDNNDGLYASYVFDPEDYVVCAGRRFRGEGYNAEPYNTSYDAQYYLQAPDHDDISPLADGEMTLTGWFKTTSNNGTIICKSGESDNSREYRVFIQGGTLKVTIWNLRGAPFTTDIANNVSDGQWHAFGVTVGELGNSGNIQIKTYLDGNSNTDVSQNYTSYCQNTSGPLTIGAMYWTNNNITDYFDGIIDEISMTDYIQSREDLEDAYQNQLLHRNTDDSTRDCPNCTNDLHHLEIIHDGSAIACAPEEITIRACADTDCSSRYMDGINGTLTAGENMTGFSIPAEAYETVIQMYMPADSTNDVDPQSVSLGLESLSETPGNGHNCINTSTNTSPCIMSVYEAGFIFDIPNLRAATKSENLEITAVQSSTSDPNVCTPLFESGERTIYFWGQYTNPDTGKGDAILIDENPIETITAGTTPAYSSSQNLIFTNGRASLPEIQYNDVGLMQLNARYEGSDEHEDTGLVVFGSDTFAVKPDHFKIDHIKCSDGTDNPGAIDSEGDKFCRAGEDFHVQVSARNAADEITENYGRENSPESVNIVSDLVEPVGGNAPELYAPSISVLKNCEGNDTDATFCLTTSWPEVGIIKLIPGVGDGDYLEAGDVNETAVEYVGRFYPDHFELTPVDLTNRVESGCSDSTFTYMGENLEFTYTLTAINANGDITENYIGSFAKFEGETTSADYSIGAAGNIPDGSTTDLTSRLAIINVSRVADWTVGNAGFKVKLNVDRLNQPDGPFTDTRFGVFVRDSDEVEIEPLDLDVDIDGSDDYAQAATSTLLRYGRIRLENAHGSELLPLAMPIFIEYYKDGSFRFNTHDTCTKLTHASETDHIPFKLAQDEDSEDTDWSDANQEIDLVGSGNTQSLGFSEVSNAPSSPYIISSNTTLDNDPTNLILSPPGAGNTGHIFMHADLSDYPFLQYDWSGDGNYDENPSARATFGIFKGNEHIIYLRETTWR